MRFEGRVALITAAASGIGRATAEIISAEGGTVVAVDTDEGRLKDMVTSPGGTAIPKRAATKAAMGSLIRRGSRSMAITSA